HCNRSSARGVTQINSCRLCLPLKSTSCPFTACGNIAPLLRADGIDGQVEPTSCIQRGCWRRGHFEMEDGRNAWPHCSTKMNICGGPLACAPCQKWKRTRSAPVDCAIRFA